MRTLALDAVLLLGLVIGVWSGFWLNRRTDLSPFRDRGVPRYGLWVVRGVLFLGPLCLVTLPFDLVAKLIG